MCSKNSMSDYFNAGCSGCFSDSPPFAPYKVSLTNLDGISGASEYAGTAYPNGGDIQGAQIHNVIRYRATPQCGKMPYEKDITWKHIAPWWGQPMEGTFMNAIKRDSEPVVKTYKDLKFTPISTQKMQTYVPEIYTQQNNSRVCGRNIEGFGGMFRGNRLLMLILVLAVVWCMCKGN